MIANHSEYCSNTTNPRADRLIRELVHQAPQRINNRLYTCYNFTEPGRFVQLWFHKPTNREVLSLVVWTGDDERRLYRVYAGVLWDKLSARQYACTAYVHDSQGQLEGLVRWFLDKASLIAIQPEHQHYTSHNPEQGRTVCHCLDAPKQQVHVQVARPAGPRVGWWQRLKNNLRIPKALNL